MGNLSFFPFAVFLIANFLAGWIFPGNTSVSDQGDFPIWDGNGPAFLARESLGKLAMNLKRIFPEISFIGLPCPDQL
jgi:hypothetical protein